MTFKPSALLVGLALLSGCVAPAGLSGAEPKTSLTLQPTIRQGDLRVQSLVKAYDGTDIQILRVTLSKLNGSSEEAVKDADGKPVVTEIPGERLDAPIVFDGLAFDTTYRIRAFAYADLAKTVLISSEEGSRVDLEVERDDRPELTPLPVQLIDKVFSGESTAPYVNVSAGEIVYEGFESIRLKD